jgi:hypothetical protein
MKILKIIAACSCVVALLSSCEKHYQCSCTNGNTTVTTDKQCKNNTAAETWCKKTVSDAENNPNCVLL